MLLSPKIEEYWIKSPNYYSLQSLDKFLEYFFGGLDHEKITGTIYDIQDLNTKSPGINVLLCVENCPQYKHYQHYNKYGNYSDSNIKIYLYNHIDKCVFTNKYIAIPIIYLQMTYFMKKYNIVKPLPIPVNCKKFCLITTSIRNQEKVNIVNTLQQIAPCNHIDIYKQYIGNKSCYHSQELLDIFHQYKFVFVCENSIRDGYITEKIFNAFFSRTIPIYFGPSNIYRFFNKNSFVYIENPYDLTSVKNKITMLNNNDTLYNTILNNKIVNTEFDDEDYIRKTNEFINLHH